MKFLIILAFFGSPDSQDLCQEAYKASRECESKSPAEKLECISYLANKNASDSWIVGIMDRNSCGTEILIHKFQKAKDMEQTEYGMCASVCKNPDNLKLAKVKMSFMGKELERIF